MNMKTLIFAVFALIALSSQAFATNLPEVIVETISPQPVSPGSDLTLKITLNNPISEPVENVPVTLTATYPFVLKSSENNIAAGVSICGGCKYSNTYFLTVDSQAISGTYQLYIKAEKGGFQRTTTVDVKVVGTPNIVFSTTTDTQNIIPDTPFSLQLDLNNIGSGHAKEVKVTINSSSIIALGGSTKTIDSIPAKKTGIASFEMIASESIEAGSYNVPVSISYLDEKGNVIATTQSMGVRVVNAGLLNVQSITITGQDGSSYITAGKPFVVIARIENVGHGTADFIVATLACPFNGESQAFLGQLDKKEDSPAVFNFVSDKAGTFACSLHVNFKDDTGEHSVQQEFNIAINQPDMTGAIVFAVIVLIILLVFRRRVTKIIRGK